MFIIVGGVFTFIDFYTAFEMAIGEMSGISNSAILEIYTYYEEMQPFIVYYVIEYYFEDGNIITIRKIKAFTDNEWPYL